MAEAPAQTTQDKKNMLWNLIYFLYRWLYFTFMLLSYEKLFHLGELISKCQTGKSLSEYNALTTKI